MGGLKEEFGSQNDDNLDIQQQHQQDSESSVEPMDAQTEIIDEVE